MSGSTTLLIVFRHLASTPRSWSLSTLKIKKNQFIKMLTIAIAELKVRSSRNYLAQPYGLSFATLVLSIEERNILFDS